MVLIPPGEFLMGSSDDQVTAALKVAEEIKADPSTVRDIQNSERPQHRVLITKPFLMGATEITVGQFAKFIEQSGYKTQAEEFGGNTSIVKSDDPTLKPENMNFNWRTLGQKVSDDAPATQVTWNDAVAFCNWLSEQEKMQPCYVRNANTWTVLPQSKGYRLPTEAEWEYACRAGTTTQYSFGDDYQALQEYAWFQKNNIGNAQAVGLKLPNPYGLYDMHGNLYEWCQDFFAEKWYEQQSSNRLEDPTGPSTGSDRVIRGGYWSHFASNARSAYRYHYGPSNRNSNYGFRVVRVLDTPADGDGPAIPLPPPRE